MRRCTPIISASGRIPLVILRGTKMDGDCRQNMVGSLPRGMPKVVDYRQTGVQATNEMMTQDRHEVLSRFSRREGVIPTSCV